MCFSHKSDPKVLVESKVCYRILNLVISSGLVADRWIVSSTFALKVVVVEVEVVVGEGGESGAHGGGGWVHAWRGDRTPGTKAHHAVYWCQG